MTMRIFIFIENNCMHIKNVKLFRQHVVSNEKYNHVFFYAKQFTFFNSKNRSTFVRSYIFTELTKARYLICQKTIYAHK
jgi:hypothetical protein